MYWLNVRPAWCLVYSLFFVAHKEVSERNNSLQLPFITPLQIIALFAIGNRTTIRSSVVIKSTRKLIARQTFALLLWEFLARLTVILYDFGTFGSSVRSKGESNGVAAAAEATKLSFEALRVLFVQNFVNLFLQNGVVVNCNSKPRIWNAQRLVNSFLFKCRPGSFTVSPHFLRGCFRLLSLDSELKIGQLMLWSWPLPPS